MQAHNDEAIENGGIVIALGVARYEKEVNVSVVYELADQRMYENKSNLKARKKQVNYVLFGNRADSNPYTVHSQLGYSV